MPASVFLGLVEALIVVILVDQARRFVEDGDFGAGNVLVFVLLLAIVAVMLYFVGYVARAMMLIVRYKVWLDGPFLVKRGVLVRRRIDLRTAQVALRSSDEVTLALIATDPRSGKSVTLPLEEEGGSPASFQLAALADAILEGSLQRTGADQEAAMAVASRLRDLWIGLARPLPTRSDQHRDAD